MQGARASDAKGAQAEGEAGKLTHTVSLQLSPDEVKKVSFAKDLGKLSLAIRAAVDTRDVSTTSGCDVSQQIARQSAIAGQSTTVVVYTGDKAKEYSVKRGDTAAALVQLRCVAGSRPPDHSGAFGRRQGQGII